MYTTTDRFTSSCALGSDTVSSVLGGLCLGNGFSLRKLLIDVKAYFLVHHVEQKRSEGISTGNEPSMPRYEENNSSDGNK